MEAGQALGSLHLNYEKASEYYIKFEKGGWEPEGDLTAKEWFYVRKMANPSKAKKKDLSRIVYNEHITIQDIPPEAYNYIVNGRSAIWWIMDRQRVNVDDGAKGSGIVDDANDFANETMRDPAYPLRLLAKVITVSLKTNKIVDRLREVDFDSDL